MEEALIAFLLDGPAVAAKVNDRVTPVRRDQAAGLPAVVVHKVSRVPRRRLDGRTSMTRSRVQIDCWGATFGEAEMLARVVIARLDAARIVAPGVNIRGVFLADEGELDGTNRTDPISPDQPMGVRLDFFIHHKAA